jgi:hypothetical protein
VLSGRGITSMVLGVASAVGQVHKPADVVVFPVYAVLGTLIAYGLIALAAHVWESQTWPKTPRFARGSRPGSSQQLREDTNATFFTDNGGFLFRRRLFFMGTACPPVRLDPAWHGRARQEQTQQPVPVTQWESRRFWWFNGAFYWENQGLNGPDLHALVRQRQRNAERKMEHARSLLNVEQNGGSVDTASGGRVRRPIPREVKRIVFERDGGRCVECDSDFDLQYDHVIPHSMGGAESVANLQLLCSPCNQSKGARL